MKNLSKNWNLLKALRKAFVLGCLLIGTECVQKENGTTDTTSLDTQFEPLTTSPLVDVEVTRPKLEDSLRQIVLPGSIEAYEKTTLYAKVSGYLESINVDIGDRVRLGDVVAELAVPEMIEEYKILKIEVENARVDQRLAEARLEREKADHEIQELTFKRLQSVRQQDPGMMPKQQVDEARSRFLLATGQLKVLEGAIEQSIGRIRQVEAELEELKILLAYASITAPFSGIVTERFVDQGALIQSGTSSPDARPLVTIAQVQRLRVFFDVPEREIPFLQVGDRATITLDALNNKIVEGRVSRFSGVLNPATRTMRTEINISNQNGTIRPGMYARVLLFLEKTRKTLTLPAQALRTEGDRSFVYVADNMRLRKVWVQSGADNGFRVEILKGLDSTEQVVVTSRASLSEGITVRTYQLLQE